MTANAHASRPGGPGPAGRGCYDAVALASWLQRVIAAASLRLRQRRSLRAIERNLAASDPSLTHLFSTFTLLAQGEERGPAEESKARPLRALARWLATALEFDPADPYRRSPTAPRGGRRAGR
jgi:hypothetical protein